MDHRHVVSLPKDAATLKSNAKDCVTRGTLQVGDEVLVCAKCRLTGIYRAQDWTGRCQFCGGSDTLPFPNGMDAVLFPGKLSSQNQQPAPQHRDDDSRNTGNRRHTGDDPNRSGWVSCLVIALLIGGGIFLASRFLRSDDSSSVPEASSASSAVQTAAPQTTTAAPARDYPDSAVEYLSHTYCFYDISLSWTEAERYCEGLGGHLATVSNANEQLLLEALTESSTKKNIWIGARLQSGSWQWIDGTPFDYQNWDLDKPDNYQDNEFYLRYANDDLYFETWSAQHGKWDDCAENASGADSDAPIESFGFVCEWDS